MVVPKNVTVKKREIGVKEPQMSVKEPQMSVNRERTVKTVKVENWHVQQISVWRFGQLERIVHIHVVFICCSSFGPDHVVRPEKEKTYCCTMFIGHFSSHIFGIQFIRPSWPSKRQMSMRETFFHPNILAYLTATKPHRPNQLPETPNLEVAFKGYEILIYLLAMVTGLDTRKIPLPNVCGKSGRWTRDPWKKRTYAQILGYCWGSWHGVII